MDVIERIDCDSSAESDVSEVSDGFSIVSNDDDLEPLRETDVTTTSTITISMNRSTGNTSNPTSKGVSLLSVLKAPSASDFSCKRKIAKNPPAGKKRTLHSNFRATQKPSTPTKSN